LPPASTVSAFDASWPVLPKNDENRSPEPDAFNFAANTSSRYIRTRTMASLSGKSSEAVVPVTQASFAASSAIAVPSSAAWPPRYVEYPSAFPAARILVTNASAVR
jgi:hypothetical protein